MVGLALAVQSLQAARQLARDDPIIRNIWAEGVERFQASTPSRVLADSIGEKLRPCGAYGLLAFPIN